MSMLDNEEITFIEEIETPVVSSSSLNPWKILIVDDDLDVHSVTNLTIKGVVILNRVIETISAYSGAEANDIIKNRTDIDFMFLDCVMENDHAGFDTAKYIRNELKRDIPIIVLRTGWTPSYIESHMDNKSEYLDDFIYKTNATAENLIGMLTKWLSTVNKK